MDKDGKKQVLLVCSGLDHVCRGYERFFLALAEKMQESSFDASLIICKGAGVSRYKQIRFECIHRSSMAGRFIEKSTNSRFPRAAYQIEQWTFARSLIQAIAKGEINPSVIYFCDTVVGTMLWKYRERCGKKWRQIFHNGAPFPGPISFANVVHHLTPVTMPDGSPGSESQEHKLIPLPLSLRIDLLSTESKLESRARLNLPMGRTIVLSVGAVNRSHKRMDYVIREFARLSDPTMMLLIVGQFEAETVGIQKLANDLIRSKDGCRIVTAQPFEMSDYYQAADVFVLASLKEGFGLVYVEALAHGLPVVADRNPTTEFVVSNSGTLADLSKDGELTQILSATKYHSGTHSPDVLQAERFQRSFSWDGLIDSYLKLLSPEPGL